MREIVAAASGRRGVVARAALRRLGERRIRRLARGRAVQSDKRIAGLPRSHSYDGAADTLLSVLRGPEPRHTACNRTAPLRGHHALTATCVGSWSKSDAHVASREGWRPPSSKIEGEEGAWRIWARGKGA